MPAAALEKIVPVSLESASRSSQGSASPQFRELASPDLPLLFRQALDEVQAKHDYVARLMGLSPSHFSEMLKGQRAFTLDRLKAAPIDVQQAFAKRYSEAMGLRVQIQSEQAEAIGEALAALGRLTRVLLSAIEPKMAKAGL